MQLADRIWLSEREEDMVIGRGLGSGLIDTAVPPRAVILMLFGDGNQPLSNTDFTCCWLITRLLSDNARQ